MYRIDFTKQIGIFDEADGENAYGYVFSLGNKILIDSALMQIKKPDQSDICAVKVNLYENGRIPNRPLVAMIQEKVGEEIKYVIYECIALNLNP